MTTTTPRPGSEPASAPPGLAPSPTGPKVLFRALFVALLTAAAVLVGVLVGASPAAAAPADYQMPFACNEVWRGATYSNHGSAYSQTSSYPLDLNSDNGDAWEYGHPVVASAGGTATVASQFPGYGNYVTITHGTSGWKTVYAHLSSVSISNGTVTAGQPIGAVGNSGLRYKDAQGVWHYYTGIAQTHLHYEQVYNNVLQPVSFNGTAITYNFAYNGTAYTSANCGAPSGPITLPDRSIVQGPNGALYVMAGGAKFHFGSMQEYTSNGYSGSTINSVSQASLDATPNIAANKTVLHATNGSLAVMAGGAKFYFGSMDEYHGQGYVDGQWINVPQAPFDAIGSAPSALPYDNTLLRQPDGTLAVMAGGVKFAFSNMGEYYGENYTDAQMVYVTQWPAANLPTAPTTIPGDGNVLVAPNGTVYVLAGGVMFAFNSMTDYYTLGYNDAQIRRVPQAPLSGIPDGSAIHPPANRTVLRAGNGQVYVVAGGVLFPESTMEELAQLGYGANTIVALTDVHLALFGTTSTTVPPNETLLQGTDTTVWVMKSGVRRSFTGMTQFAAMGYSTANIVRVPDAALSNITSGAMLP